MREWRRACAADVEEVGELVEECEARVGVKRDGFALGRERAAVSDRERAEVRAREETGVDGPDIGWSVTWNDRSAA